MSSRHAIDNSLETLQSNEDIRDYLLETCEAPHVFGKNAVTTALGERLSGLIEKTLSEIRQRPDLDEHNVNLDKQIISWKIKLAALVHPQAVFDAIGLISIRPPAHIHRMQKSDPLWIGDFYSSNMVIDALNASRVELSQETILDLGCSSGSLLRVLRGYDNSWNLYGCDPIGSAIDWAQDNVPGVAFDYMSAKPPLIYDDAMFSGVTAISIWSHHSPKAAKLWFGEVARILKPGGWFFLTYSSHNHVLWSATQNRRKFPKHITMLSTIERAGNYFEHINYTAEDSGTNQDWGHSVYDREAFFELASQNFTVKADYKGANQGNQNAAVLIRK